MTSASSLRAVAAGVATAIALTGCGQGSPAPAADATGTKAFVYDIVHRKFAGPNFAASPQPQLLSLGQGLCASLDKGRTVAQLSAGMLAAKSLNASPDEQAQFLSTAVVALCPKYSSSLVAVATPAPKASSH